MLQMSEHTSSAHSSTQCNALSGEASTCWGQHSTPDGYCVLHTETAQASICWFILCTVFVCCTQYLHTMKHNKEGCVLHTVPAHNKTQLRVMCAAHSTCTQRNTTKRDEKGCVFKCVHVYNKFVLYLRPGLVGKSLVDYHWIHLCESIYSHRTSTCQHMLFHLVYSVCVLHTVPAHN
jgi:hypothetical protein